MDNRDTYEASGGGPSVGFGGPRNKEDTGEPGAGAKTPMDEGIEEERQRRQENWSPAGQTGFDNDDVERHDSIYTDDEQPAPEKADRESVKE